jgi:hypothetical protein
VRLGHVEKEKGKSMNPYGSYRALLGNSTSAMLAAIEIYNKPKFDYRSECFTILLLNSWELLFKAILSKNKIRIFEPKRRDKPYVTLKFFPAMEMASKYFPADIPYRAVSENISRLVDYRNNAVHFYNENGFETVIYGLAQTSIVNFRDIVSQLFDFDIAGEVNICLLPLSFSAPPDPIAFLGRENNNKPAISEFLAVISQTTKELENENIDTGRFLTVFEVNLQSTKKIQSADITVGVDGELKEGMLLVSKKVDPNKSHPHLRKAILVIIGDELRGIKFTTYVFDAIVWHKKIKTQDRLCWHNVNTKTYQYSQQLVTDIRAMSASQIQDAISAYKKR